MLLAFAGILGVATGDRGPGGAVDEYRTAHIDMNGTSSTNNDVEGLFRFRGPKPTALTLLVAAATGLTLRRSVGAARRTGFRESDVATTIAAPDAEASDG